MCLGLKDYIELQKAFRLIQDVDHYKHLKGLHFLEISSAGVEILIGAGILQAHQIVETRFGSMNQPKAVKTGLGWSLVRPDQYVADGECSSNCRKTRDLRQQMLNMFEREFNEDNHADCDVFLVEDSRFLKMMTIS